MHWELWDTESANLVDTFETEDEALQGVRDLLAVNTPDYVEELSLGAMYDPGEPRDVELPPVLIGEMLKARLAEMAQDASAETSRAVHERIRKWLAEEGWDVREVHDSNSTFNVMVKLRDHREVNIYQLKDHVDHVTFHVHLVLTGEDPDEISQLPETIRRNISWDIFRDMALMNIDFTLPDIHLVEMRFHAYAYFDGMTKDVFIHKILLVLRAVSHSIHTIARGLESAGRPAEATSRLLRLVPSATDALTAAS
jgi:hypothetical protein